MLLFIKLQWAKVKSLLCFYYFFKSWGPTPTVPFPERKRVKERGVSEAIERKFGNERKKERYTRVRRKERVTLDGNKERQSYE